ncbi:hypothetical protein Godav_027795, partial [Gossypium davidsonii]|nr:hypothetical protein [Gossypium davidsonii]
MEGEKRKSKVPVECWKKLGACLKCGLTKHMVRDCPHRSEGRGQNRTTNTIPTNANRTEARQPTLIYVIRGHKDRDASNTITAKIFVDFYSLTSSPFTHSFLEEPYLTLTKFSPQKHSNGSHFLLPSTLALLSFIQRQDYVLFRRLIAKCSMGYYFLGFERLGFVGIAIRKTRPYNGVGVALWAIRACGFGPSRVGYTGEANLGVWAKAGMWAHNSKFFPGVAWVISINYRSTVGSYVYMTSIHEHAMHDITVFVISIFVTGVGFVYVEEVGWVGVYNPAWSDGLVGD